MKDGCNTAVLFVPSPAAYCIHKILINDERTEEKQKKDAMAVANILNCFSNDVEFINSFQRIYAGLGKKQVKKMNDNAERIGVTQKILSILKYAA